MTPAIAAAMMPIAGAAIEVVMDARRLGSHLLVGTTRQRELLRPQSQYWCDSALDWVEELSSVVKVPTQ